MSIRLDLLERDGTFIKTLSGYSDPMWVHPRRGAGVGSFTIPNSHPDLELVTGPAGWWRFVRCHLDDDPRFAWQIQRDPSDRLVNSRAGRGGEVTDVTGAGALAELGLGQFHSCIVVGQKHSGFRVFGWVTRDFDWQGTTGALVSGGQQSAPRGSGRRGKPESWPEERAEWLWTNESRTGTAWVHHDLTGYTGNLTLHVAGRNVQVWIDGEQKMEVNSVEGSGRRTIEVDDSLMAVQFDGEAIWALLDEDDNTVFASTTGEAFFEESDEVQQIIVDPEPAPFPWGADYPSTGPQQLQGLLYITFRGQQTAGIEYNRSNGTYDPSDVESALEALSNVTDVEVSGSGTSSSPLLVTIVDASGSPNRTMTLDHTDLRHDHATTGVKIVERASQTPTSLDGEDAITAQLTEPDGITFGYVMTRVIADMKDFGNQIGSPILPAVSITANDELGSDGEPWAVKLPIVRLRDGEQLGDVAMQGTQRWQADVQMLPSLELWIGNHLGEDSGVQLTDATPAVGSARMGGRAPTMTMARIETEGGFGWSPAPSSGPARISLVTMGTAASVDEVQASVEGILDDARGVLPQTVTTPGPTGARPYVDYGPGWTVAVRERDGVYRIARVEQITVEKPDKVNPIFTVDLERRL